MASTVTVTAGGQLRYNATLHETNILTVTQSDATFTVTDSVALTPTPGGGCTAVDANTATCTGVTSVWVNAGNMDDEVSLGISVPSQVFGRAGADVLTGGEGPDYIEGDHATLDLASGDQINVRGAGPDTVACDNEDVVQSDLDDPVTGPCANNVSPTAQIVASPEGHTNDASPTFSFIADEPEHHYECQLLPLETSPSDCPNPYDVPTLTEGSYTLQVRAYDDPNLGPGPWTSRSFTVDTTAPQVNVTGPQTSTTATPTFDLSSDETAVTFECAIGTADLAPCASPYTTPALANGSYVLRVRGTDAARNSTTTEFPFTVGGGGPGTASPPVQPRRIIIESLVLISGRAVKMSRRGVVSIGLQCAGTKKCSGRMTITTAEPVKRRGRKLERLGSARFSIAANKRKNVKVRFSKSKRKLAKKLKRFKAKVVITEIDQRGNQRISSRVFILRAR